MLTETMDRVTQANSCRNKWCISSKEINILIDISSLATGVLLDLCGIVFEDVYWLQSDTQHTNLTELEAIIKSVNLAVHWNAKYMHLKTDFLCVNRWLTNTLTGKGESEH